MKASPWLYLVLGAVAIYVLWGLSFTVGIEEDAVTVGPWKRQPTVPPSGAAASSNEKIDWALVDSLPVYTAEMM
jgi:hypothetical protein